MSSHVGIPARTPGVPLGVNGHPERRLIPYRWRDPARCSPARLAELAAHDAHIAALQLGTDPAQDTRTAINSLPVAQRPAASAAVTAVFVAARQRGAIIRDAAAEAGVSYRHGQKIEAARREQASAALPAGCTCTHQWDGKGGKWDRVSSSRDCPEASHG